jgi:hypothetical protein
MNGIKKAFRKLKSDSAEEKDDSASGVDKLPPLNDFSLPKVRREHQQALVDQGWTTVTFDNHPDPLQQKLEALFQASKAFFALPAEYKSTFLTKEGSEDGWSRIEGEKEFITLRTIDATPPELREAAAAAWHEAGKLINEHLGLIAGSLGLPPKALQVYSEPCIELNSQKTATMLRLFRYEGHQEKTVAEPHADLGLLSFVMGDTPGLEVWNRYSRSFWPIEKSYSKPAGSLLAGRQLEQLSNMRYHAGGHRVQAYGIPKDSPQQPPADSGGNGPVTQGPYRYSIVFVCRAHSPVLIDTDELTTNITGPFANPMKCTAGEMFRKVRAAHFNINTNIAERDEQKKKLAAFKEKERLRANQQSDAS